MTCWFQLRYTCPECSPLSLGSSSKLLALFLEDPGLPDLLPPCHQKGSLSQLWLLEFDNISQQNRHTTNFLLPFSSPTQWPGTYSCRSHRTYRRMGCYFFLLNQRPQTISVAASRSAASSPVLCANVRSIFQKVSVPPQGAALICFPVNWSLRSTTLILGRKVFHSLGLADLLVGDRAS